MCLRPLDLNAKQKHLGSIRLMQHQFTKFMGPPRGWVWLALVNLALLVIVAYSNHRDVARSSVYRMGLTNRTSFSGRLRSAFEHGLSIDWEALLYLAAEILGGLFLCVFPAFLYLAQAVKQRDWSRVVGLILAVFLVILAAVLIRVFSGT